MTNCKSLYGEGYLHSEFLMSCCILCLISITAVTLAKPPNTQICANVLVDGSLIVSLSVL